MQLSRRALLALASALPLASLPAFAQDKGTVGIAMPTKSSSRWISDGNSMVEQFTAAGYAKYAGESCVWAEYTTPELGIRCREYISVNTGILMGTESWDGTKLVYRMKCGTPSVAPQDAGLFKAPDA